MLTGRGALRRIIAPRSLVVALSAGLVITSAGLLVPAHQLPEAAAAPVTDKALASKLASVLKDSRVTKGRTSAVVFDAATGSELFQRSGSRATMPASNTKIVTAAAAMHTLGPDYRFRTQVIRRAKITGSTLDGRLYLKGYGDPTARVSDYAALAQRVRAAGIRTVTGKLVVDATYFDSVRYNPTWRTSYADDYYAAEISALTLAPNADYDSGTVIIKYKAGSVGKKAKIATSPAAAASYLSLKNLTTTGKKGTSTSFSASRAQGAKTITRPGSGAQWTIRQLADHGQPAGPVRRGRVPGRAEEGRCHRRGATTSRATPATPARRARVDYSMPLSQLLVPFLKLSNNMHAEALTKAMGGPGPPGHLVERAGATRAYLTSSGCRWRGRPDRRIRPDPAQHAHPTGPGHAAGEGAARRRGSRPSIARCRWPATPAGWSAARCGTG